MNWQNCVAVKYLHCIVPCKFNVCLEKPKLRARGFSALLECFLTCRQEVITCTDLWHGVVLVQGLTFPFQVLSSEHSRIEEIVNNLLMLVLC